MTLETKRYNNNTEAEIKKEYHLLIQIININICRKGATDDKTRLEL